MTLQWWNFSAETMDPLLRQFFSKVQGIPSSWVGVGNDSMTTACGSINKDAFPAPLHGII
jgi:hypothetical protein